jgi:hypothetical protein
LSKVGTGTGTVKNSYGPATLDDRLEKFPEKNNSKEKDKQGGK